MAMKIIIILFVVSSIVVSNAKETNHIKLRGSSDKQEVIGNDKDKQGHARNITQYDKPEARQSSITLTNDNHLELSNEASNFSQRRTTAHLEAKRQEWESRSAEKIHHVETKKKDLRKRRVFVNYEHNNKAAVLDAVRKADEHQVGIGNPKSILHYDFDDLDTIVITATEEEINELRDNENIISIEDDAERYLLPMFTDESDSDEDSIEKNQSHLRSRKLNQETPWGIDFVNARGAHSMGIRGQGVKVCIIDSGLYPHSDFSNTRKSGWTDLENGDWTSDGCSHGTHVAGTIAANDNGYGVLGVAPDADLHIVRIVSDDCRVTSTSRIVDAAFKCRDAGANVVNISLGGAGAIVSEQRTFQTLKDQGVTVVAAAGNTPGYNLIYPAYYDTVISVAAVDQSGNQAGFSTTNDRINVAAPGVDVRSTVNGGGYGSSTGTSMASPHAVGVAALVLQAKPGATPHDVLDIMCNTARNRPSNNRNDQVGCGTVNARAAVGRALNGNNGGRNGGRHGGGGRMRGRGRGGRGGRPGSNGNRFNGGTRGNGPRHGRAFGN